MPLPKRVLNAFTARELYKITGLSMPMIDYLLRMDYLKPTYGHGERGRVRYYSYRDLVVARVVQRLRETGVELSKLKRAIQNLSADAAWFPAGVDDGASIPLHWLVTDGKEVLLRHDDGFLDELKPNGQRAFAFIVSLGNMQEEVKQRIPPGKLKNYSMQNLDLIFEPKVSRGARVAPK